MRAFRTLIVLFLGLVSPSFAQVGNWTQKFPAATPPERFSPSLAFDAAHGQVVLFGGIFNTLLSDTWIWDGSNWIQKFPSTSPPGRLLQAMAYDAQHAQVVLFGGEVTNNGVETVLGDTWIWDGSNWIQKFPANSPGPRAGHAMVYDSVRNQVLLFGGSSCCAILGDTWTWDGANWTLETPATSPPNRFDAAMTFDTNRGEAVLFGGVNAGTAFSDTWVWDGLNWTQRFPVTNPQARAFFSAPEPLAYDVAQGGALLFGETGNLNDTWIWDGSNWAQQFPSTSPPLMAGYAMAYDTVRNDVVLLGTPSIGTSTETWVWSGASKSCQVNVTNLYQAVNASGVVQPWACNIYNHPYGTQSSRYCAASPPLNRIAQVGCALTALTMSLDTAGLSFDPGTLNSFMLQPQNAFDYGQDHGVSFDTTVSDAASFSGKTLNWTSFSSRSTQDLQSTVCSAKAPVIVGVDLTLNQANQLVPGHYVLVTGWDGAQFQIADPGFPSRTSLSAYGNQFVGAGYVTDPQNARSSLHISVTDAELVVTDQNGLKSGFDVMTSQDLNQIPSSAYSRSGLVNDESGQPASQIGYYLDIHQPADGAYAIIVQGLKLETYDLTVRVFDVNGNPEPPLSVVGLAAPGSSQTLNIQSASSVGALSTVGIVATFQTTLADIQNGLALGLIDNVGIADSLAQKIQAAQTATGSARSNILNAFKNEVTALSSVHINGIAPQVLLQDADALLGNQ